ncbi:DNA recombination protein RmuC [bacterium]|nr:DNA recombination protein RmuC [bacterium]
MQYVLLSLLIVVIVLLVFVLLKKPTKSEEKISEILKGFNNELGSTVRGEFATNRKESNENAKVLREEVNNQIKDLSESTGKRLDYMRDTMDQKLKELREDNEKKLEQMRQTVDEKLHTTLEKRLGESFNQVSKQLESVQQGLGEMKTLAADVGDFKKVLTNVKARGTWGEIQLGNLLEEILTPEQYEKDVQIKKGSKERVEYAIKLPGKSDEDGGEVFLPIDAKFPQADYSKLLEAQEKADVTLIEIARKQLADTIKKEARSIKDKYLDPPKTTDFGIMFLPTESLFAEIIRIPGLSESLQSEFRVAINGPTTLAAFLNSLHMGFRTLTIQKRSSEVWKLLGAVKTEFGNFGQLLETTQKQLQTVSGTIKRATTKTKTIQGKLRKVEELPVEEAKQEIGYEEENEDQDDGNEEGNI